MKTTEHTSTVQTLTIAWDASDDSGSAYWADDISHAQMDEILEFAQRVIGRNPDSIS